MNSLRKLRTMKPKVGRKKSVKFFHGEKSSLKTNLKENRLTMPLNLMSLNSNTTKTKGRSKYFLNKQANNVVVKASCSTATIAKKSKKTHRINEASILRQINERYAQLKASPEKKTLDLPEEKPSQSNAFCYELVNQAKNLLITASFHDCLEKITYEASKIDGLLLGGHSAIDRHIANQSDIRNTNKPRMIPRSEWVFNTPKRQVIPTDDSDDLGSAMRPAFLCGNKDGYKLYDLDEPGYLPICAEHKPVQIDGHNVFHFHEKLHRFNADLGSPLKLNFNETFELKFPVFMESNTNDFHQTFCTEEPLTSAIFFN